MSARLAITLVVLVGFFGGCRTLFSNSDEAGASEWNDAEAQKAYEDYMSQMAKKAEEYNKQAVYRESSKIPVETGGVMRSIPSIALTPAGGLLVCDTGGKRIHCYDPDGKLAAKWPLDFTPQAVAVNPEGVVFAAGEGKLARLDKDGKASKTVNLEQAKWISGMTVSERDLFIAVSFDTGFTIQRHSLDLTEPAKIAERLRGCCGTLDLSVHENVLYVAENARHRVVKYDRDGKELGAWGKAGEERMQDFGSCCSPMNLCVNQAGQVFTVESGPDRVKQFSVDGNFIELIAAFDGGKSCRCVDIAAAPDGKKIYIADDVGSAIRVLTPKETAATAEAATQPVARKSEGD